VGQPCGEPEMKWYRIWLELLRKGCLFVLPLDRRYRLMHRLTLDVLINEYSRSLPAYTKEVYDCDDFAWVFKGEASRRRLQAVGFVIGWRRGLHCWNVAVTHAGVFWIEPQNGDTDLKGRWYIPWLVII